MSKGFAVQWDNGVSKMLVDLERGLDKALRPAAQAGAQVLYDEARSRAPVSAAGHWFYGTSAKALPRGQKKAAAYWFDAGSLQKAIYQKHVPEESDEGQQVYAVSWRYKGPGAMPYGWMVEYGTSRAAGHPFMRPAYDAKSAAALKESEKVLFDHLRKAQHGGA